MEYNSIKGHPDLLDVLDSLAIAQKAYDRNMKIAAVLIGSGSVLIAGGLTIIGVQEQMLRRYK